MRFLRRKGWTGAWSSPARGLDLGGTLPAQPGRSPFRKWRGVLLPAGLLGAALLLAAFLLSSHLSTGLVRGLLGLQDGSRPIRDKDGAELVLIPAGPFRMGSTDADVEAAVALAKERGEVEAAPEWFTAETPSHQVELPGFYIDRYEVMNKQYGIFVRETRREAPTSSVDPEFNVWKGGTYPEDLRRHPVVNVSWADASAYCAWVGGRLPTEAEWEKAARGDEARRFPWGNEWEENRANYGRWDAKDKRWSGDTADGYLTTAPVGSFPQGASPYGVQDLAGNVWEWVSDWYGETYYQSSPHEDPPGPASGKYRALRGGGWNVEPRHLRSAVRFGDEPADRHERVGFRCAQDWPSP